MSLKKRGSTLIKISNALTLKLGVLFTLLFFGYSIDFFYRNGYFPYPFFLNIHDTAMDFYNVNFWALGVEAYSRWGSFYSTANLALAQNLTTENCKHVVDAFQLRACNPEAVLIYSSIITGINATLLYLLLKGVSYRFLWLLLMIFSFPMLYGLERGNYIQLAMVCISVYLLFYKTWVRELGLIGAILSKIYLVIFLVPLLLRARYRSIVVICGVCLFLSTIFGWHLSTNDWYLTIVNILGFSVKDKQLWVVSVYAPTTLSSYGLLTANLLGDLLYGVVALSTTSLLVIIAVRLGLFILLWRKLKNANEQYLLFVLLSTFLLFSSAPGYYALILLYPFFAYFLSKYVMTNLEKIIFIAILLPYPLQFFEITQHAHFNLALTNDSIYLPITLGMHTVLPPALLTVFLFLLTRRIYVEETSL